MRFTRQVRFWQLVVFVAVLVAALSAASIAFAALPSGWSLQKQINVSGGPIEWPSFADSTHGWAYDYNNGFLFRTTNGSAWVTSAPAPWLVNKPGAVSFGDRTHGWAVGGNGLIYASTNGGSTWATQTPSPFIDATYGAVRAVGATHVWAFSTNFGYIAGSANGGTTWTQQYANDGVDFVDAHFVNATHGWAVGETGDGSAGFIAATTNGSTWITQTTPATGPITSVWFYDTTHGWAVASNPIQVLRTTDGGAHWSIVASNPVPADTWNFASLVFVSPTHGYMGTEFDQTGKVLYQTTDAGVHWTGYQVFNGPAGILGMTSPDRLHVWATGGWGSNVELQKQGIRAQSIQGGGDPQAIWVWRGTVPVVHPLGTPVIKPQFPRNPYVVEDDDWLTVTGTLSPKHKPGTYGIGIRLEKLVKGKWTWKASFSASITRSWAGYSAKIMFPSKGSWRIRAYHGTGKTTVWSGYRYYTVIPDLNDIP